MIRDLAKSVRDVHFERLLQYYYYSGGNIPPANILSTDHESFNGLSQSTEGDSVISVNYLLNALFCKIDFYWFFTTTHVFWKSHISATGLTFICFLLSHTFMKNKPRAENYFLVVRTCIYNLMSYPKTTNLEIKIVFHYCKIDKNGEQLWKIII